jgi:hypothetical protein
MWLSDGCFVQLKHVAVLGFAMIKVVCRRNTCILLRVLQSQGDITPQKGSYVSVESLLHQILGDCVKLC